MDQIILFKSEMSLYQSLQIVILSFNRPECLSYLFENLLLPAIQLGVKIIIIDNGSERDVRNLLSKFSAVENLEIIQNKNNFGVARGRNIGFRRSRRPYIIYLDDDSIIELADLKKIPQFFRDYANAGIIAFKVVHGKTYELQNDHGDKIIQVGNFHGAGHAIRKVLFDKIGYLDDQCFFGAEEIEFSMRSLKAGYKTLYIPDIIVKHFSMVQKGRTLFERKLFWSRNYAMVLFRYLPLPKASLFCIRLFTSYVGNGIRDIHLGVIIFPFAMIYGAFLGLRSRNALDKTGIDFYTNPATRPEIGNVSLYKKIKFRVVKS